MSRNKQRNKELSLTFVKGRLSLFLDERAPRQLQDAIRTLGIEPILLPPFPRLPAAVSAHPDLLLHDLGGKLLIYREYYEANRTLFDGIPAVLTDHTVDKSYPADVGMDALCLGNTLYCLPKATCPEILQGRELLPVRQGYAACACLKVTENAIVTADSGIADAAKARGVSVLRIRPGFIELPGYDYGFIGGTAFLFGDTLCFAGDLSTHPDGGAIADFCKMNGVTAHSLVKEMPLRDLGFLKYNEKAM
ncbi:MAG: hypothetical protein IKC97_06795 [Clostridia bacterium]|nr:hypothetical protein [Clostridia bacterium]